MKISGNPYPSQHLQNAAGLRPAGTPQSMPTQGVVVGAGTQAGAADDAAFGLSPEERLERYASQLESRLANLEQNMPGIDLSSVRADFSAHLERLHNAMENGLSGDDLARGIERTVDLVRTGVQDAVAVLTSNATQVSSTGVGSAQDAGAPQTDLDIQHSLDRLDALQASLEQRLANYMSNLPEGADGQALEATGLMQDHFERLRDAVATGGMSLDDVRRSLDNILQHLRDNLAPRRSPA
ncbi:MAG: hypothetical protein R3E96_14975 [Planctomycetota bacterium]